MPVKDLSVSMNLKILYNLITDLQVLYYYCTVLLTHNLQYPDKQRQLVNMTVSIPGELCLNNSYHIKFRPV